MKEYFATLDFFEKMDLVPNGQAETPPFMMSDFLGMLPFAAFRIT